MENIYPWQYMVIAGPAFIAGLVVAVAVMHEKFLALCALEEYLLMEQEVDPKIGHQEISKRILDGSIYGRKE